LDRERGAGYYNFYLIFFVFVSTRRKRERLLLLLLGCCCCSSFLYLSLVEGWSDAIYFHPAILIWLEDGTHSGFVYVIFPHPRRSKREITNSLSSAQQLTRRKALGEIKKTFFLSFVFFSFVRVKSLVHLLQLFFLRLLFVCYSFISSFHQYRSSRERRRRESQCVCVCVCVPTQSFFFLKIKKEFKIIFSLSIPKIKERKIKGGIVINMPSRYEPSDRL
jgi:hypothetical protein